MSYCTVSDVRYNTPDLTTDDASDSTVSYFISSAESEINDALRHIYVVPFASGNVPSGIRYLCARIAAYRLLQSFPDRVVQEDLDRLEYSLKETLRDYAKGKKYLGSDYELETPTDGTYFAATSRDEIYTDYEVDK